MVSGRRTKVPTPLLSMVRRRKPIASAAGGFAGSTVPERALPKTGSLDMVMEKDGHFDIERSIFHLRSTAQLYTKIGLYNAIDSAYTTLACYILLPLLRNDRNRFDWRTGRCLLPSQRIHPGQTTIAPQHYHHQYRHHHNGTCP
jgi:hypothetical protein